MTGWHVRFLLKLCLSVQSLQSTAREEFEIDLSITLALRTQSHEEGKVLLSLTRTEIDSEPCGIELPIEQARIVHRLLGRADSEANVQPRELETLRVINVVGQIEAFDFGRELGWKMRGIEMRD